MIKGYAKKVLRPLQIWLNNVIDGVELELARGSFTEKEKIEEFLQLGTTNSTNNKIIKGFVEKAYGLSIENALLQFKRELTQINSFLNLKTGEMWEINPNFTRTQVRILMSNKNFGAKAISKYAKKYGAGLGEDLVGIFLKLEKEPELKGKDRFKVLQHLKMDMAKEIATTVEEEQKQALQKFYNNFTRLVSTQAQRAYQDTVYLMHGENKEKVLDPFLRGYKWRATGSRACAVCRARNGQFFEPHEVPYDHPRGMCDLEPVYRKDTDAILVDWVAGKTNGETNYYIQEYVKHLKKIQLLQLKK